MKLCTLPGSLIPAALALLAGAPGSSAPLTAFRVTLAPGLRTQPATGRLIVLLIREGARVREGAEPVDGPFWDDPQPLFGLDATLAPGGAVRVDGAAEAFPAPLSELAPGTYRAQARFDLSRTNSDWRREPGNLWSEPVRFEVASEPREVELVLSHVVEERPLPESEGVKWFELRSELLSAFRGHEVRLHAGVVLPQDYDPARRYGAVYEVPGFGGDHRGAARRRGRGRSASKESDPLARECFTIVLDPEGPNGHSLFVDSANNGPCGAALVRELIPALERAFPLIAAPAARLLRGHSSGGWSTLWLALTYPETFGATWSSAPDPVDFRRFQLVDIYGQPNFYTGADGKDLASLRSDGAVTMTIRQESRGEDVLGADNTSAQQWDSWFAAFGPRNERGNPAALFDPKSGAIDKRIAEHYRAFDFGALLCKDPARLGPLFQERVRLIVGSEDSFYLNEAVALLRDELAKLPAATAAHAGYVKIVPGDHGSVFADESMRKIPDEMLAHLRQAGHLAPGN